VVLDWVSFRGINFILNNEVRYEKMGGIPREVYNVDNYISYGVKPVRSEQAI
jgi:hypothetical protein